MSIAFECPFCARPHRVDDKYAGKRIVCKKCAKAIRVPGDISAASMAGIKLEAAAASVKNNAEAAEPKAATTIHTSCPYCERPHKVDVRYAGRKIKCKKCGDGFRVPLHDGVGLPGNVAREELIKDDASQFQNDRAAHEEAQELAAAEAERLQREVEAKAEAERLQREAEATAEAERLQVEADAKAEAERLKREAEAKAEAERLQREAEAKAATERLQREAEAKAEAERLKREAEAKAEAERLQREAEAKAEAERLQREAEAKAEAERLQREAQAKAETERLQREAEAKAETERLQRETEAKAEKMRLEREAAAKAESDRAAREEANRVEAQRKALEETQRLAREEADRKAREEAARIEAERVAKAAQAKLEAQRLAKMEVDRIAQEEAERAAEAEAQRLARIESERQAHEEAERLARVEADQKAQAEAERLAKIEADRKARAEADLKAREVAEQAAKIEAERKAREDAERQAQVEADQKARLAAEHKAIAEAELAQRAEVERNKRLEAEELARAEAAKAVAQRLAKMEAERTAREESERLARAETERIALAQTEKVREEAEREEAERLAAIQQKHEQELAATTAAAEAAETAETERISGIERFAREQAERLAHENEQRKAQQAEDETQQSDAEPQEQPSEPPTAIHPSAVTPPHEKTADRAATKGFWGKLMGVWKKPEAESSSAHPAAPMPPAAKSVMPSPSTSPSHAAAATAVPAADAPAKSAANAGVMTVSVIAPIVRAVAPKAVTLQSPVMAEVFKWDSPQKAQTPAPLASTPLPTDEKSPRAANAAAADAAAVDDRPEPAHSDDATDAPLAILVEDADAGVVPPNASATEVFELNVPESLEAPANPSEPAATEFVPAELLDEEQTDPDSGEDWVEGAAVDDTPHVTVQPREHLADVTEPQVARAEMPSVAFPRPETDEEKSAAGSPILRHRPRDSTIQIAPPLTPYLSHITGHIERTIGRAPIIFHELLSVGVHIDLHVIPPTDDPPTTAHPRGTAYFTIVTSGLSTRPMNVPAGCDYPAHAELMLCLPVDWPGMNLDGTFDTEKMRDEKNWWPLRWLKAMARMPHEYNTFIGPGHTVPNGPGAEPFAENTAMGCMLVQPSLLNPRSLKLVISGNVTVQFYALWPIYREELEFKQSKGVDALVERFRMAGTSELIQLDRKNVCRR